jgi:hypothetical protein
MKYLRDLIKRAECRFLQAYILLERPDLKGKTFRQQLNTYMLDTVQEYAKKEIGMPLPWLLERVCAYDATESIGHYRASLWVERQRHTDLLLEHGDEIVHNIELQQESIEARKLARQAIAILEASQDINRLN